MNGVLKYKGGGGRGSKEEPSRSLQTKSSTWSLLVALSRGMLKWNARSPSNSISL